MEGENSKKIVPELTASAINHINKGEVKYVFKDVRLPNGRKEFTFTSDNIWAEIEADFNRNGEFTQLLFDSSFNRSTVNFIGMHNFDNLRNMKHENSPTGNLFEFKGFESIGEVGGKNAYTIIDPKIWIPDLDNLVSKNKNRNIENRVWDGAGKWQLKKEGPDGRLSSCFIEGMSVAEINQMISEAFRVKKWYGTQWEGIINYKGKIITLRGYSDSGNINSVFIKKIE